MFSTARQWYRSIAVRLLVPVLCSLLVIVLSVTWYIREQARSSLIDSLEFEAQQIRQMVGSEITGLLGSIERLVQQLGSVVEIVPVDRLVLHHLLQDLVAADERLHGVAAAFEPYAFNRDIERLGTYYFQSEGAGITYANLAQSRYWEQAWYRGAVELRQARWSEPYVDAASSGAAMISYSVPLFRENLAGRREPVGVVRADLSLNWLSRFVESFRTSRPGFGVILSSGGRVVSHPEPSFMLQDIRDLLERHGDDSAAALVNAVLERSSGTMHTMSLWHGEPIVAVYGPLGDSNFGFAYQFPQATLYRDIESLSLRLVLIQLLGLALLAGVIVVIVHGLTRPLRVLSASTRQLASGRLDEPLPIIPKRDEIGTLASDFETMRTSLQKHIEDLEQVTAARQKLETELGIAGSIQHAMLAAPRGHYHWQDGEIDLQASLVSAKAVGGDLYEHFLLTDGRLLIAVGDVADKGIPAALFMARTLTLLRVLARDETSPGALLAKLNRELCLYNESCMFVTLFCAVVDLASGEMVCASAGHDPALLVTREGDCRWTNVDNGAPLGLDDEMEYPEWRYSLRSGDRVVLYSDGVTEAVDSEAVLYSPERLERGITAAVMHAPTLSSAALMEDIVQRVWAFSAGAEQADDQTLLVARYLPSREEAV